MIVVTKEKDKVEMDWQLVITRRRSKTQDRGKWVINKDSQWENTGQRSSHARRSNDVSWRKLESVSHTVFVDNLP